MPKVEKGSCKVLELRVLGSFNQRGGGVGIVLKSPHGEIFEQSLKLGFKASNNEVEYDALINGLKMSLTIGISGIKVMIDPNLVAQQLNGEQNERMVRYIKVS